MANALAAYFQDKELDPSAATTEELMLAQQAGLQAPNPLDAQASGLEGYMAPNLRKDPQSQQAASLSQLYDNKMREVVSNEQLGQDQLQKYINDYQNKPQEIDWLPLATLSGNQNAITAAQALRPESEEVRNQKIFEMQNLLQKQKAGLSKTQLEALSQQLKAQGAADKAKRDEKLLGLSEQKQTLAEKKADQQYAMFLKALASKERVADTKSEQAGTKQTKADEKQLRKEWSTDPVSKNTKTISENYQKVMSSSSDPSAAGDLAMVFSYMKMLDPGSVVREQEFANAQNAAGVPDQIRNAYNRALTGERLNPAQRQDFMNTAEGIMDAQLRQQESLNTTYRDLANQYGVSADNVVLNNINKPKKLVSTADSQALEWAKSNPNDPMAAEILKYVGGQ